jgi:hypothetical protein
MAKTSVSNSDSGWASHVAPLIGSAPANLRQRILALGDVLSLSPLTRKQSAFLPDKPETLSESRRRFFVAESAELSSALALEIDRLIVRLTEQVDELAPQVVFRAFGRPVPPAVRNAGLNRLLWAVGAGSGGKMNSDNHWDRFLTSANDWLACWELQQLFSTEDAEAEPWARKLFIGERYRKLYVQETRLSAFSQQLCLGISQWVEQLDGATAQLGVISTEAVNATFAWLRRIGEAQGSDAQTLRQAPEEGRALLELISLKAGSRAGSAFDEIMLTGEVDRTPFVNIDGTPVPLAWREALTGLEIALLSAIGRTPSGDQGAAFEQAAARAIAVFAPEDTRVISSGLTMRPRLNGDDLQIDLALQGDGGTWIVECKALVPHVTETGVAASFSDDLSKGLRQANKRLHHLRSGGQIRQGRTVMSTGYSKPWGGFVMPLHSFGGSVWNAEAMSEGHQLGGSQVIPAHALLLVLSSMRSARELRQYLAYREVWWRTSFTALDELDVLLAWFNPHCWELIHRDGKTLTLPYSLPWSVIQAATITTDRNNWRQQIWDMSESGARVK